jgi:protoporphyrinogen oxidase
LQEQIEVLNPLSNKTLVSSDFTRINSMLILCAIPQYHLGHLQLLENIKAELAQYPGLHLAGNYLSGVSIADTVKHSLQLAQQFKNRGVEV